MTTVLAARVDAGARLLDEKRPGWHREIAMDKLAMASCSDCILGQVYGGYDRGLEKLFGNVEDWDGSDPDADSGFDLLLENQKTMERKYGELAHLWRAEIRKRLEAGS